MTAVTRHAGREAVVPAELTRWEKLMLVVAFIAWGIVSVLVIHALAVGFG